MHEAKRDRKNTSMLLSNGFATLFLVFHPYYADAFKFTLAGEEEAERAHSGEGQLPAHFRDEISGGTGAARAGVSAGTARERHGSTPETGSIARIEAGIADSLQDVGLKSLEFGNRFCSHEF